MWGPALSLMLMAGAPCGALDAAEASWPAELRAQIAVAAGRRHRSEGDLAAAEACVVEALRLDPDSTLALRTRAQLGLLSGDLDEASVAAAKAAELGDADPELAELRAVIEAARGERDAARTQAARARTWAGTLIGASLDDPKAAFRASDWVEERTRRGVLSAMVVAAHLGRRGEVAEGRALAARAESMARALGESQLRRAGGVLIERLAARSGLSWTARIGTAVDYLTNPGYVSAPTERPAASARAGAFGDVGARFSLGPFRVSAAAEVRQHGLLARRDDFCCLDLFVYRVGALAELPLGADPRSVRLGLVLHWTDVFADGFRYHHASHLEGGPRLAFELGPRMQLDLSFLGVYTDFVSGSPPDQRASSLNRDRLGQRAVLGFGFGLGWLEGRLEGMFLNDDAEGDAFDVIGGAVGGSLRARPQRDLTIVLGGSLAVREFGPVGDRAVIGDAATRTEVRSMVRVGARLRLVSTVELVIEDTFINSGARTAHDYRNNLLSVGVQSRW